MTDAQHDYAFAIVAPVTSVVLRGATARLDPLGARQGGPRPVECPLGDP